MVALGVALALSPAYAQASPLLRLSRPAAGSIVGITVRVDEFSDEDDARAAIAAGFAAIEAWEAQLSEWRPDSLTSRLNAGEAIVFPPEADAMLLRAEALRVATDGAFSLTWQGGALTRRDDGAWTTTGPVGLGAVLKGFLVDRAADALRDSRFDNFLIEAAGDVYAAGDSDERRGGWPVVVRRADGDGVALAWIEDQGLSTSGDDRQPGHIHDPRDGRSVTCTSLTTVIATTSEEADALATALFASCGAPGLAESHHAWALRVDADGQRTWTRGARRHFR